MNRVEPAPPAPSIHPFAERLSLQAAPTRPQPGDLRTCFLNRREASGLALAGPHTLPGSRARLPRALASGWASPVPTALVPKLWQVLKGALE